LRGPAATATVAASWSSATLLLDLLTEREADDRRSAFDITRLANQVAEAVIWVQFDPSCAGLPIGLVGFGTGAAAALVTSARFPGAVAAVVSCAGRPDLAGKAPRHVHAPTLLTVGARDRQSLALNRMALETLCCKADLAIELDSADMLEEPQSLASAMQLGADWFASAFAGAPSCPDVTRDVPLAARQIPELASEGSAADGFSGRVRKSR
jgi:dienelactone hydrolase